MRTSHAYTLIELLVVLALVTLLASLALPGMQADMQRQTGSTVVNDLSRLLAFARATAVSTGTMVTLCRSGDGLVCGGLWQHGILVFTDANANRTLDGNDRILRYDNSLVPRGSLRLGSFPNRQYLQFTPEGFTNKQNGSFTWCPASGEAEHARQLIFSQSGRSRTAFDSDGDGIREDASGKALSCG